MAAIDDAQTLNSPVLELRAIVDAFRIGGDSLDRTGLHERLGTLVAELGSEGGADVDKWLGATYDCDFAREGEDWKMRHLVLRIQKMVDLPEEVASLAQREERA